MKKKVVSNILILFVSLALIALIYPMTIIFLEKNFNLNIKNISFFSKINERYYKFFLLKNNKEANTFILGTSSSTLLNSNLITYNNDISLNLSFSGANSGEYLQFLKWIIKNRKPKKIFVALKYYNFQNLDLNQINPSTVNLPFYEKIFSSFNIELFKIYKDYFIYKLSNNLRIKDFEKKKIEKIFYSIGMRMWPSYLSFSLDGKKLQQKNILSKDKRLKLISNSKNKLYINELDENRIQQFIEFVNLCKKNNIDTTIFFDPSHLNYLKKNHFYIINQELIIIERLLFDSSVEEIKYYNNFNEFNLNKNYYFVDYIHYDYNASSKLIHDLIKKDNNSISLNFNKKNFTNLKTNILKEMKKYE